MRIFFCNHMPQIIYAAIVASLCAAYVAAFWPGIGSYDTYIQWQQVKSGVIDNYHPPLLAWWWGAIDHYAVRGYGGLFLFNNLLFSAAIYIFGSRLLVRSKTCAYMLLLLCSCPPIISMLFALWKDVGMVCALLLACALMFSYSSRRRTMHVPAAITTFLLLLYGMGMRHNAITALPPLCLWMALCMYGHTTRLRHLLLAAFGIFITLCVSLHLLNEAITDVKRDTSQQVQLVQLLAMSQRLNISLFPESYLAEKNTTYSEFSKKHRSFYNYTPLNGMFTENPKVVADLRRAFLHMIINHPAEYTAYRWEAYKHLLRIGMDASYFAYTWHKWGLTKPGKWIGSQLWKVRDSLWFKPWIWLIAGFSLFGAALWCLHKQRPGALELAFLTSSSLLYELALFFITPSSDFRYSYWLVITVVIGFPVFSAAIAHFPAAGTTVRRAKLPR
jgi:hypothetical protein